MDVVISNRVIDLVPDKEAVFAEIDRVLRPGGRLQVADGVLAACGDESEALPPSGTAYRTLKRAGASVGRRELPRPRRGQGR